MENKNKENKNSKRGLAFGLGLGLGIPVATVLAAGIVLAIKNRYDKNLVIYTNGVSELEPIEISNDYCFATITAKYKNIDITLPKFGYGISNPNVLATAEKTNNGWNLNMYTGDVDAGSSFQATLICTDSSNHKNRKVVDFYIRRGLDALQWSTEGEYQSTMTDEEMIATFKENNLTKKDGGLLPNDVYNNVDLSIVMVGQDKAIKITTKESSTAYQGETILIISPEQEAEIEGIDSVISSKGGTYNLTVKDSEGNVKNITSAYAEYDPEGIVTVELVDTNKLEITPIEGKEGEVNIRLHVQDDAGFRGCSEITINVFSEDHNWIVKTNGEAIAIADNLDPASFSGLLDPGGTSGQDKYLWVKDREGNELKIQQYSIKEINIGNTSSSVEQLYTPYGTKDSQNRTWYGFLDDVINMEYANFYGFSSLKSIKTRYFMYYQPKVKTIDMRNMINLECFIDTNVFESGDTYSMAFNNLTTICLPNRTPPEFKSEAQQCVIWAQFLTNPNLKIYCGDHLDEYKTANEWKKLNDAGLTMVSGYPEE